MTQLHRNIGISGADNVRSTNGQLDVLNTTLVNFFITKSHPQLVITNRMLKWRVAF